MLQSEDDFIAIKPPEEIQRVSKVKSYALGSLKNSILQGSGNYVGYLGELTVRNYLGGDESCGGSVYNHDIVIGDTLIEVKSKKRSVKPKLEYEVSIAKTSTHQHPDYYIFVSVSEDTIWILGYISYQEFFKRARLVKKGEIDPSNGFICREDMYNLTHRQLYPIREFQICTSL